MSGLLVVADFRLCLLYLNIECKNNTHLSVIKNVNIPLFVLKYRNGVIQSIPAYVISIIKINCFKLNCMKSKRQG